MKMLDVIMLKSELTLIVNSLAKLVVTQIRAAAQKDSLQAQSPEDEEKLSALVDTLCTEAIEKILKMIESPSMKNCEANSDHTNASPTDENPVEPVLHPNGAGGVQRSPAEQTYILVYGSDAVDSKCLLLPLQSSTSADGEEDSSRPDVLDKVSPPARQDDLPDHIYARPPVQEGPARKRPVGTRRPKAGAAEAAAEAAAAAEATTAAQSPQQCERCQMLLPSAERLAEHQRKAHPACSACGQVFSGVLKLRQHRRQEHGLLPFACDYCAKGFNHKAHRDLHVRARHTGQKTCRCDVCGKAYSCRSVLKTHRLTHFDKAFICDVCGKSFYHACHLTRHKLVHQEVRPFRCSTCGRGFTQAENLRSHQLTHGEGGGERQLCAVCGKSFRRLRNHLISKHWHELPAEQLPARASPPACRLCAKTFPNPSQLRAHQRSHAAHKPHRCDVCGKSYRLRELLRDHRHTHTGERPYTCGLCSKSFNMAASFARHRSIHSGRTPYACADCGKHFRLLGFLKAHLQTKAHLRRAQQRQDAATAAAAADL